MKLFPHGFALLHPRPEGSLGAVQLQPCFQLLAELPRFWNRPDTVLLATPGRGRRRGPAAWRRCGARAACPRDRRTARTARCTPRTQPRSPTRTRTPNAGRYHPPFFGIIPLFCTPRVVSKGVGAGADRVAAQVPRRGARHGVRRGFPRPSHGPPHGPSALPGRRADASR